MGINNSGKFNKSLFRLQWFKSTAYWSECIILSNLTFYKQIYRNGNYVCFSVSDLFKRPFL